MGRAMPHQMLLYRGREECEEGRRVREGEREKMKKKEDRNVMGGGGVRKENDMLCLMTEHTHKNKLMSEELYTQQHNKVCKAIRWHIHKNFDVPVPENLWEY